MTMQKLYFLLIVIISGVIAAGCSDNPTSPDGRAELGEPFQLIEGQAIVVAPEELKVEFLEVTYDGRCPIGLECFYEGLAELEIGLRPKNKKAVSIYAGISGSGNGTDYRGTGYGYSVVISALDPYPKAVDILMPIVMQPYRATLTVFKATEYPEIAKPVIITNAPPDSIMLHSFDLMGLDISGDTLAIRVAFGGGCRRHYFWLYMSPAAFLESEPVQANLYLRHFDNDDMCDAWISDTLKFDLSPVRELYQQMYSQHGSIRLNLYEYFIGQPGEYIDIIYSF
jgi:hypothetical protein